MSREVRRVPANWQHPRKMNGSYKELFDTESVEEIANTLVADTGLNPEDAMNRATSECMPKWSDTEATHYMLYETVSAGTPVSPAFATTTELAKWCAEHPEETMWNLSLEDWVKICNVGFAPSAVM